MKVWSLSLVFVAALASSGCSMCCPSYDYCSPTNPGESNSVCCGRLRRGSVFGGEVIEYSDGAYPTEVQPMEDVPAPQPNPALEGARSQRSEFVSTRRTARSR